MMIETYMREHVKIIKISGEVEFENYNEFGESLLRGVEGFKHVILDLTDLTYLNSMGLSMIMKTYRKLHKEECELKLCSLAQHIKKLFTITKLDRILSIHDSLEEAFSACENAGK